MVVGDCLEFNNSQTSNKCSIKETQPIDLNIKYYYTVFLRCNIRTTINRTEIYIETENKCLDIHLQCIQISFLDTHIFEEFFRFYHRFIDDLFDHKNGTDQNLLHVIVEENTVEEINLAYIESIFVSHEQSYRGLFLELHSGTRRLNVNRDLIEQKRLSIKLILVCDQSTTIYVIHQGNLLLESKQDSCAFISSSTTSTISFTSRITHKGTTESSPTLVILALPDQKSTNTRLIVSLLSGLLLCFLVILVSCYLVRGKRHRNHLLNNEQEQTSDISSADHQDTNSQTSLSLKTPIISPLTTTSPKAQRQTRGIRAVRLFEDDI